MQVDFYTAEVLLRIGSFVGVFALMALWELVAPRRPRTIGRIRRWPGNLGIVLINTVTVRILFPTAAVGVAVLAQQRGWGLLSRFPIDDVTAVVLAMLILDLAIYWQHRFFHAVPLLWRLHRMHHADIDIDVTTGNRFHPAEIVLSMLIKFAVIIVVGASPLAVLLFEILLNATSQFNHSNVYISPNIDRILRWLLVTPDMHRVHHSVVRAETDSNFGFNIPWWDRLFGSYAAQPRAGHLGMTIGLSDFRDPGELRLDRMLLQPLRQTD